MRANDTVRARTALAALGALTTTGAIAAGTALAQEPAPAPAAPPATAAAPAKTDASVQITKRRLNVRTGRRVVVRGKLTPAGAGRRVSLQRRAGRGWRVLDRARTTASGRFTLRFRARRVESARVRVFYGGDAQHRSAKRIAGRLNAYRPALASWYGPGLYGNPLGCGGTLGTGTIGVAHKSLPCGTKLTLRLGNRTVRARVIDRGPYVGAREFDLTQATKQRLGFGSTGTVLVAH